MVPTVRTSTTLGSIIIMQCLQVSSLQNYTDVKISHHIPTTINPPPLFDKKKQKHKSTNIRTKTILNQFYI